MHSKCISIIGVRLRLVFDKLYYDIFFNYIKFILLFGLCMVLIGCASVGSTAFKPGATIADNKQCLLFVNIKVESDLNYLLFGKQPFRANHIAFNDVARDKFFPFTLDANMFISNSTNVPYRKEGNTTDTPVVVALPPGTYVIDRVWCHGAAANTSAMSFYQLRNYNFTVTVPNTGFISIGTLVLTQKEKRGVGDILQGFKDSTAEKSAIMRELNDSEREFAIKTYPVLTKYFNNQSM